MDGVHDVRFLRRAITPRGIAPPALARNVAKNTASLESNAQAMKRAPPNEASEIATSNWFDMRALLPKSPSINYCLMLAIPKLGGETCGFDKITSRCEQDGWHDSTSLGDLPQSAEPRDRHRALLARLSIGQQHCLEVVDPIGFAVLGQHSEQAFSDLPHLLGF